MSAYAVRRLLDRHGNMTDSVLGVCSDCGSAVVDLDQHNLFHTRYVELENNVLNLAHQLGLHTGHIAQINERLLEYFGEPIR